MFRQLLCSLILLICLSLSKFLFLLMLLSLFVFSPLSSNRMLRIFSCYSTSSDQSLGFHSFKFPLFQRALAVGLRMNSNVNQCFSTAGLLLHVLPQQHQRRRAGVGVKVRERDGGSQVHITHESHVTPTRRITGPGEKGRTGRRHMACC